MGNNVFDLFYNKAVSEFFLDKLESKKKTIDDLSRATGVKYNTLFRYLNGSRQMPVDLFKEICEYLELDFEKTFRHINKVAVNKTMIELKGENNEQI